MALTTNFNQDPYYDDFNDNKKADRKGVGFRPRINLNWDLFVGFFINIRQQSG